MHRTSTSLAALAAVIFCAGMVSAAPKKDEPANDQPAKRFVDRGRYVEDMTTGLLWQKDGKVSGKMDWQKAQELPKGVKVGKLTHWRVPTREELAGIFPATDRPWTNSPFTPDMCCGGGKEFASYWTSELDGRLPDYAWCYQWYNKGGANNCTASKNFLYVRLVHDPVEKDETREEIRVKSGKKPPATAPADKPAEDAPPTKE